MLHGGCYRVGGDDPGCVSFLLIFFCLFLVPLQGTMDRWSWVYLTLTIVQNPHAHCANPENHYVLEHVGYTNSAHCAQWGRCLCRMVCCLLLRQCGRSSTKENCNLQDKRKHPKLIWNIVGLLHKWREQDLHKLACAGLLQNRQEFGSDLPPQNPSKFQQVVKIHHKKPWLGAVRFLLKKKSDVASSVIIPKNILATSIGGKCCIQYKTSQMLFMLDTCNFQRTIDTKKLKVKGRTSHEWRPCVVVNE
jgi:hypothetical protein